MEEIWAEIYIYIYIMDRHGNDTIHIKGLHNYSLLVIYFAKKHKSKPTVLGSLEADFHNGVSAVGVREDARCDEQGPYLTPIGQFGSCDSNPVGHGHQAVVGGW